MDEYLLLQKCILSKKSPKNFAAFLEKSEIKNNKQYLGKLLMDIIKHNMHQFKAYLKQLCRYGVDVNFRENKVNKGRDCQTPLMLLCQNASSSQVLQLWKSQELDPTLVDSHGDNALFYALKNRDEQQTYQIISLVIARYPKLVNTVSGEGKTLLMAAVGRKSLRIVQLLLNQKANPNKKYQSTGETALHHCLVLFQSSPQAMKNIVLLLLNSGANPEISNRQGQTCFDLAKKVGFQLERILQSTETIDTKNIYENEITSMTMDQNSNQNLCQVSSSKQSQVQIKLFFLEQIRCFQNQCQNVISLAWTDMETIYQRLQLFGRDNNLRIDLIGSYAYGLWTETSDIDISFTNQSPKSIKIDQVLQQIYQQLSCSKLGIHKIYLNVNDKISFPNLKIQLDKYHHHRKLDITVFQKKNNSLKYVNFVKQKIYYCPIIQPIFFVLKRLLVSFNMHNPCQGGIKTYGIFLMIWNLVRNLPDSKQDQAFIYLIYYYAHLYQYEEISEKSGKSLSLQFNIKDPLNDTNNVGGRKTNVQQLRKMFKSIDYALRIAETQILPYIFSLHKIFSQ